MCKEKLKQLHSYVVFLDAKRAYSLLESVADDEQLFRIYWTTCIALLRTIADVVTRVDCEYNDLLRNYWERRKKNLQQLAKQYDDKPFEDCPQDYLFWTRLFRFERNLILHEYEQGFSDVHSSQFIICSGQDILDEDNPFSDSDLYRTMEDVDYWGDWDCRDWIQFALCWWEKELENLVGTNNEYTGS